MWEYTDCGDSTRFTSDELKEAEIDDRVRAVTSLTKKMVVPKKFGIEAFSKLHPRTEVRASCSLIELLRLLINPFVESLWS
jgi:hypothetical protein